MHVTLEPKTRAGKNKLASDRTFAVGEWDGTYRVQETRDHVNFAAGKRGPWHMLVPACSVKVEIWRWVHATDDENFILRPNT